LLRVRLFSALLAFTLVTACGRAATPTAVAADATCDDTRRSASDASARTPDRSARVTPQTLGEFVALRRAQESERDAPASRPATEPER